MKDRMDLSALDPSRQDAAGWERRIQAVVARAVAAQRWTVARQLSSWARPAMTLAAAAALFSWLGLFLALKTRAPASSALPATAAQTSGQMAADPMSAEQDPHVLLSRWAAEQGGQPSVGTLLTVLGE